MYRPARGPGDRAELPAGTLIRPLWRQPGGPMPAAPVGEGRGRRCSAPGASTAALARLTLAEPTQLCHTKWPVGICVDKLIGSVSQFARRVVKCFDGETRVVASQGGNWFEC